MIKSVLTSLFAFTLFLVAGVTHAENTEAPTTQPVEGEEAVEKEPEASLQPRYRMVTNMGEMLLELDAERAPITVLNFDQYVRDGFYDGTVFHRIVPDFVIQGGGFTPDYEQKRDGLRAPIKNEWLNRWKNTRGTLSMARLGRRPDSATSQFFINLKDNENLDLPMDGAAYAVFGEVIEGMDVVDKIAAVERRAHPNFPSPEVPAEPVIIEEVEILVPLDREGAEEVIAAGERQRREQVNVITADDAEEMIQKIQDAHLKMATITDSGLAYVITEGDEEGTPASDGSAVVVSYTGRLLDGTEVDRRRDVTLRLGNEWLRLQGLREGILRMNEGQKAMMVLPPELGYGEQGLANLVPPDSTLVYEVELKEVK